MNIIKNEEGELKISDNEIFILLLPPETKNPTEIFIKEDSIKKIEEQNPSFFKFLFKERASRRLKENSFLKGYEKYSIKKDFEIKGEKNDCLLFAERVSLSNPKFEEKSSIFSVKSGKTDKKFGVSDKGNSQLLSYTKNYEIKKNPLHNLEVNPNIGDAYAMLPAELPIDKGTCPYHAASVIFKDGNTNITIEADAGIKTDKPIFDMYSSSQHKYSFYASHMKTYLDHEFDEKTKKIKFKLPTTLLLKNTFKEKVKTKPKYEEEQEEKKIIKPIRRSSRLSVVEVIPLQQPQPLQEPEKKSKTKKKKQKKKKPTKKWFSRFRGR
jgi:hypothetical protein